MYKRFWFEFEKTDSLRSLPGILIGCGVTAIDYFDAVKLMDEKIFVDNKRPPFSKGIENVDIRDLDQDHVVPNMRPPTTRGIWFPLGYD